MKYVILVCLASGLLAFVVSKVLPDDAPAWKRLTLPVLAVIAVSLIVVSYRMQG